MPDTQSDPWHAAKAAMDAAFEEAAAFKAEQDPKHERPDGQKRRASSVQQDVTDSSRAFWASVAALTLEAQREPDRPLPRNLVAILHNLARGLAIGQVQDLITDAASPDPNGRRHTPFHRDALAVASAYLAAVERKDLKSRSPTKDVAEAFGVSLKAARLWKADAAFQAEGERLAHVDAACLPGLLAGAGEMWRYNQTREQTREREETAP